MKLSHHSRSSPLSVWNFHLYWFLGVSASHSPTFRRSQSPDCICQVSAPCRCEWNPSWGSATSEPASSRCSSTQQWSSGSRSSGQSVELGSSRLGRPQALGIAGPAAPGGRRRICALPQQMVQVCRRWFWSACWLVLRSQIYPTCSSLMSSQTSGLCYLDTLNSSKSIDSPCFLLYDISLNAQVLWLALASMCLSDACCAQRRSSGWSCLGT